MQPFLTFIKSVHFTYMFLCILTIFYFPHFNIAFFFLLKYTQIRDKYDYFAIVFLHISNV